MATGEQGDEQFFYDGLLSNNNLREFSVNTCATGDEMFDGALLGCVCVRLSFHFVSFRASYLHGFSASRQLLFTWSDPPQGKTLRSVPKLQFMELEKVFVARLGNSTGE